MNKEKPTLAAIAICQDEEDNLPGLIENLRDLVDQLIIVDSGSNDQSRHIAEAEPNVLFIDHPMTSSGGYAGQRNAGIEHSDADWLLHMDCDERVSEELATEILNSIDSTSNNGFRYQRLNYFLNRPMRHGGWTSWNRPQLARRGKHTFVGKVHETCKIEGGDQLTGQLAGKMIHLNEATFADRLEKSARYVVMTAERYEAEGKAVSGLQIVLRTAREFLKKYVVQRGFLDGVPGLISALHSSTAEFRALALVWDRQNKVERKENSA